MLVNGLNRLGGQLQRNPLVLFGNEKALFLQVRVEPALGLIVRVGDVIPNLRPFSGDLTNSSHNAALLIEVPF